MLRTGNQNEMPGCKFIQLIEGAQKCCKIRWRSEGLLSVTEGQSVKSGTCLLKYSRREITCTCLHKSKKFVLQIKFNQNSDGRWSSSFPCFYSQGHNWRSRFCTPNHCIRAVIERYHRPLCATLCMPPQRMGAPSTLSYLICQMARCCFCWRLSVLRVRMQAQMSALRSMSRWRLRLEMGLGVRIKIKKRNNYLWQVMFTTCTLVYRSFATDLILWVSSTRGRIKDSNSAFYHLHTQNA